ncbi:hypothetical protein [Citrobacter meridianamericanus]|uniref:hypothetical protein n=1 Tax=Citrobacter meridianamericanus TaxID=2894201 RepID=UPI00351D17E5
MNNVIKLSMIAALTMSSASVFAAAGDPVTGGSGSVTVDGTVQTNTCAVAVDKTALTMKVMKADLDKSSGGVDLPTTGDSVSTFTLSNCSGQPIKVLITPTSGSAIADMAPYWSIPATNQIGIRFATVTANVQGGKLKSVASGLEWTAASFNYTGPAASVGVGIEPSADTTTVPVSAYLAKRGSGAYTGPSTFTTGYTYNLTYM